MSKEEKPTTKKGKKALQTKKNRKFFEMMLQHKQQHDEVDIAAPEIKPAKTAAKVVTTPDGEAITQQVQRIRNRITGRKRASQDRWNRFAGTSGGGGRGR